MTSPFSWQNSISICPASFRIPRPNLPVTPGVSWLPTFAFQSPIMKRTSVLGVSSRRSSRSSSVQFSRTVVSDSLRPHESQHARPSCPLPTPRVHSDSRPSSQWCRSAISSSVVPFSSCPQSLPASESFPMSQFFITSHKKEWNLCVFVDMYSPRWYYTKWNKSDREKQITVWFPLYMKSETDE